MSDIGAAAAAVGIPEDLLKRSADARAVADGVAVDDLVAAWAGGAPAPAASAAAPDPDAGLGQEAPQPSSPAEPTPPAASEPVPEAPVPEETSPAGAVAVAVAAQPPATPVLEAQDGKPLIALLVMAGLFFIGLLVTMTIPSTTGGDYTHLVPDALISEAGEAGLEVYLAEGCWYCHTQLVRPVLADVGLGPAVETYADALDTPAFGIQRIGPDLAHIGSRASLTGGEGSVDESELRAVLTAADGEGLHPSYSYLSAADMDAVITYLLELK